LLGWIPEPTGEISVDMPLSNVLNPNCSCRTG
jgi:hypothetical protein